MNDRLDEDTVGLDISIIDCWIYRSLLICIVSTGVIRFHALRVLQHDPIGRDPYNLFIYNFTRRQDVSIIQFLMIVFLNI
jgi:hypothetical protein